MRKGAQLSLRARRALTGTGRGFFRFAVASCFLVLAAVVCLLILLRTPVLIRTPSSSVIVPSVTFYVSSPPSTQLDEDKTPTALPTTAVRSMIEVQMPYKYPMHKRLPNPRHQLSDAIRERQVRNKNHPQCLRKGLHSPFFLAPPQQRSPSSQSTLVKTNAEISKKLETEFDFVNYNNEVFYDSAQLAAVSQRQAGGDAQRPWWVQPDPELDLPCTAQIQQRLFELQHPPNCHGKGFLITKLKEGAHGIGSALSLVAHDLLSAVILNRVLQVQTSRWFFASPHCVDAQAPGWECFFAAPSVCRPSGAVETVKDGKQAKRSGSPVIVKHHFDIDGLSRNDVPSDEQFFGKELMQQSSCYAEYKDWIADPANTFIQGTFDRGADARLFFMLSQAMKYLMRAPQPWFRHMLRHHLPLVGIPSALVVSTHSISEPTAPDEDPHKALPSTNLVYIQERGEIAKFREYYNVFGCHTLNQSIFVDYVRKFCDNYNKNVDDGRGGSDHLKCRVYVSGNTPLKGYHTIRQTFESDPHMVVLSTWKHPLIHAGAETERWGANFAASSWVDMFAGVSSSNWICIVQSNWCRVINFLRLTSGRARCGFVDAGALMISDGEEREKYCVVGPYPTKAFSNRIK